MNVLNSHVAAAFELRRSRLQLYYNTVHRENKDTFKYTIGTVRIVCLYRN